MIAHPSSWCHLVRIILLSHHEEYQAVPVYGRCTNYALIVHCGKDFERSLQLAAPTTFLISMDAQAQLVSLGTPSFGFRSRWGCRSRKGVDNAPAGPAQHALDSVVPNPCPPALTSYESLRGTLSCSVTRNSSTGSLKLVMRVPRWREFGGKTSVLISEAMYKLYCRHLAHVRSSEVASLMDSAFPLCSERHSTCAANPCCLPGGHDERFLKHLFDLVLREQESAISSGSWQVTPDLYSLWSLTSALSVELFADSLNESGVCRRYCSLHESDKVFGSLGSWHVCDSIIEGGGANPPFHMQREVCSIFERGVMEEKPYCRCAVLSLSNGGGVRENITHSLSSNGFMLMSFPAGALPFRSQHSLLSTRNVRPTAAPYLSVGLFIWVNRSYLKKYPPPRDIEAAYMNWATLSTGLPNGSLVYFNAFRTASSVK